MQQERVLDHLPRPDGLAQGPLGRLFERRPSNMSARAVSPQPKQVRARKLGDLEYAFHVGGLPGVGHEDGCTAGFDKGVKILNSWPLGDVTVGDIRCVEFKGVKMSPRRAHDN